MAYTKSDRHIARAIVMAQMSSDSGKGRIWRDPSPVKTSVIPKLGYRFKQPSIITALKMIDSAKASVWHYYVELKPDQNGCPSILVYFETKDHATGKRLQISFHNPYWKSGTLPEWIGKGRPTRWNKRVGGSREDCDRLIKIFNLDRHE